MKRCLYDNYKPSVWEVDILYSIQEIKKKVFPIAEKYAVHRVDLFGSYARGEADEQSDIDLLIEPGEMGGFAFAGLYADLEDAFRVPIDIITYNSCDDYILTEILKERRELYQGEKYKQDRQRDYQENNYVLR